MRATLRSVLFILVALIATGAVAHAETEWCAEDPVLVIDGRVVDITTTFDRAYLGTIRDAILFEVEVPENVMSVAAIGVSTFVPHEIQISRTLPAWDGLGSLPVVARVTVRADASFDTFTRITGGQDLSELVPGLSNRPTRVKTGTLAP